MSKLIKRQRESMMDICAYLSDAVTNISCQKGDFSHKEKVGYFREFSEYANELSDALNRGCDHFNIKFTYKKDLYNVCFHHIAPVELKEKK